jgi:hypothetical protein
MSNQTFALKEVVELKSHLWKKIDKLESENKMLKFALALAILSIIGLVMASMYALTGSIV